MIINIRGTSGSGKSTLVRSVMELYKTKASIFEDTIREGRTKPRKRPIAYLMGRGSHRVPLMPTGLIVLGHYESPCGGCDTIPKMEEIFANVRTAHQNGHDVLFEGLLISADVKRTLALHEENLPLTVIGLDTPIEQCLDGVNDRRLKRMGTEKYTPVNPANTISKDKGVKTSMQKLAAAGVAAEWHSRESALPRLREILKV